MKRGVTVTLLSTIVILTGLLIQGCTSYLPFSGRKLSSFQDPPVKMIDLPELEANGKAENTFLGYHAQSMQPAMNLSSDTKSSYDIEDFKNFGNWAAGMNSSYKEIMARGISDTLNKNRGTAFIFATSKDPDVIKEVSKNYHEGRILEQARIETEKRRQDTKFRLNVEAMEVDAAVKEYEELKQQLADNRKRTDALLDKLGGIDDPSTPDTPEPTEPPVNVNLVKTSYNEDEAKTLRGTVLVNSAEYTGLVAEMYLGESKLSIASIANGNREHYRWSGTKEASNGKVLTMVLKDDTIYTHTIGGPARDEHWEWDLKTSTPLPDPDDPDEPPPPATDMTFKWDAATGTVWLPLWFPHDKVGVSTDYGMEYLIKGFPARSDPIYSIDMKLSVDRLIVQAHLNDQYVLEWKFDPRNNYDSISGVQVITYCKGGGCDMHPSLKGFSWKKADSNPGSKKWHLSVR